MTLGSLFAGIGGFDLGFERAGITAVWQVEIEKWKRAVLATRFPGATQFSDVKDCGEHNLRRVDVITGGFPCQPFSTSGKRQGDDDDRYLWPEMRRIVRSLTPAFVVIENVAGLAHEFDSILEKICSDLEATNYEVLPPLMVPLASFGAWHRRDRVWILAYSDKGFRSPKQKEQQTPRSKEFFGSDVIHADNHGWRCEGKKVSERWRSKGEGETDATWRTWWDAEPAVGRMVHGISTRLDRLRIAALGESVSPIAAQWLPERIKAVAT